MSTEHDPIAELAALRGKVVEVIQGIYDPEIPVNIYELGLIYGIDLNEARDVHVTMTLTSPSCPAAESLPPEVDQKIQAIEGIGNVTVQVTWDPPWTPEMMSEAARLELNMF
jgi:FeS assembly SUF system protein